LNVLFSQDVTEKCEDGGDPRDADALEEAQETRPMRCAALHFFYIVSLMAIVEHTQRNVLYAEMI
jgi:hypothetical protein